MNKQFRSKLIELIMAIIFLIISIWNLIDAIKINEKETYIQNIETKLNIYEQEYDNFVLEDSLKQSDVYERVR